MKKHLFCFESMKDFLDWLNTNSNSTGKADEFSNLFECSSSRVCDKKKPCISITNVVAGRLKAYSSDMSYNNMLLESFLMCIHIEPVSGTLNAAESTIKHASILEFDPSEEYIVICKDPALVKKLQEQNLNCVLLSNFNFKEN